MVVDLGEPAKATAGSPTGSSSTTYAASTRELG
jgi:hypothetical protein